MGKRPHSRGERLVPGRATSPPGLRSTVPTSPESGGLAPLCTPLSLAHILKPFLLLSLFNRHQVLAIFQGACGKHREHGELRENGRGEKDKLTEPRETQATTGPALGLGREQRRGPTLEQGCSERIVRTETVWVTPKGA